MDTIEMRPKQTNADKFKEVFGLYGKMMPQYFYQFYVNEDRDGVDVRAREWWDMPYEVPKGEIR